MLTLLCDVVEWHTMRSVFKRIHICVRVLLSCLHVHMCWMHQFIILSPVYTFGSWITLPSLLQRLGLCRIYKLLCFVSLSSSLYNYFYIYSLAWVPLCRTLPPTYKWCVKRIWTLYACLSLSDTFKCSSCYLSIKLCVRWRMLCPCD